VREGVGIESSLRWVAGRFAERAVEDFFASSARREFLINAAASVEFAAKGVIARHDVPALYVVKDAPPLSDDERYVLTPGSYPDSDRPSTERWASILDGLLDRPTISGKDAAAVAAKLALVHDQIPVDVAAATRLFNARNRAAHVGDIDEARLDRHAKDFLKSFSALSAALQAPGLTLFGDLVPIANQRHMRAVRSPKVETQVQVVLARRRFRSGAVLPARRSTLRVAGDTTRCPACDQDAHVTTQPPHDVPLQRLPPREHGKPVDTLDCLYCGLTLYGRSQITLSQREFPAAHNQFFDPLDHYG
jgi:hypothetical protein